MALDNDALKKKKARKKADKKAQSKNKGKEKKVSKQTESDQRATAAVTEETGVQASPAQGLALDAALGVDRQSIFDSWKLVMGKAMTQPQAAFEAGLDFAKELTSITLGTSALTPDLQDARFNDPAWQESPLYRRVGQSYLAMNKAIDTWLEHAGMEEINQQRARFVLNNFKDVVAPMNTLLGNPEAMQRLRASYGRSALQGARNFIDDVRHNYGYPAVADRNAFTIGSEVAASEGAVVFRNELLELIQYQPTTDKVRSLPLLYVFSQVNRFYLGDLTPDRSLFTHLLDAGIPVFAISWRNPEQNHKDWDLGTYAEGIVGAIGAMREICDVPQVQLMGVCAGGLTAAVAAGILQRRGDDWIRSLSLFINVLDNRVGDSDFNLFISERSIAAQKARVTSKGMFDEKDVFEMFALLRIEENIMSFFRRNYLLGEEPLKHPLLFWSMDYTRVPAGLHREFLDLAMDNRLAKREYRTLGQRVDLSEIKYPVYLMAGSTDHITPWKACYRSTGLFGGDVEFVLTNQNHTQTICARVDNKHLKYWRANDLPATADAWQEKAEEHTGSWVHHWVDWLHDKNQEQLVAAPIEFGCESYPEIEPAPGQYVKQS